MVNFKLKDSSIEETIEREISSFGTSSHIILPKQHEGKMAVVIILKKDFSLEFERELYKINPKLKKLPEEIIRQIGDLVIKPSLINLDFADLNAVFNQKGELFFFRCSEKDIIKKLRKRKIGGLLIIYGCRSNIKLKDIKVLSNKIDKELNLECVIVIGVKIKDNIKKSILTVVGLREKGNVIKEEIQDVAKGK